MAQDRCPQCGKLYALVGRRHNCIVPAPAPKKVVIKPVPGPTEPRTPKAIAKPVRKAKARKAQKKEPKVLSRKPGRPRSEDRAKTLTATQPWKKLGISERTFYRREAEKRTPKP